jgi:AmmeMemoRadiSam system protein A
MPSLPEEDRQALLKLARSALVEAVTHKQLLVLPSEGPPVYSQERGVFVTLRNGRKLRGCIGVLESRESLGKSVVGCAASAASEDPRFSPVTVNELESIRIELSVLSALVPIRPEAIRIGVHGIAIVAEGRRGVLLPQVAVEHGLTSGQFLAETCKKAGLSSDAWRDPGAQIFGFTSEVFAEAE